MFPGTTGINLGASGANIESEVDIETFGFGYEGLKGLPVHERLQFMYGFRASAEWFRSDHESEFTTPSFIDIFSETDQSVTEDAFGIGPVIGASFDIGGGFSLYGSLGVKGIYTSAELDSVQRTTCLPCAPDPTFVEIETDEEEDDFTWGSKITVGFDYHPTPRLSLNFEGSAGIGPRWEANNPENPDDDPTHLSRQHGTDLKIGAGLRWAFGAPPPPPPPP